MNVRIIPLALVGYFGLCALLLGGIAADWLVNKQPPEQPIAFSHQIHAGKLGLQCTYCHKGIEQMAYAPVPALKVCMDCHLHAATDRPEIVKLTGYWNRREPVRWVQVHRLPWHARFTHKRHLRAGVDCAVCHGEVRAEARVRKVHPLQMGWCINCHRSKGATDDCAGCHK